MLVWVNFMWLNSEKIKFLVICYMYKNVTSQILLNAAKEAYCIQTHTKDDIGARFS